MTRYDMPIKIDACTLRGFNANTAAVTRFNTRFVPIPKLVLVKPPEYIRMLTNTTFLYGIHLYVD